MEIAIFITVNLNYIPKRRFLFWWYQISEFDFDNKAACINWIRNTYVPMKKGAKRASYFCKKEVYNFHPDYRDQIDIDFN